MALRLGVQREKGFTKGISRPENKAIKMEENQKGSLGFLKENEQDRRDPEGISRLSNKRKQVIAEWNIMVELQGLQ